MYWIRAWMTVGQNLMLLLGTLSHKGYPHNLAKLLDIVFALWGFLIYLAVWIVCELGNFHDRKRPTNPTDQKWSNMIKIQSSHRWGTSWQATRLASWPAFTNQISRARKCHRFCLLDEWHHCPFSVSRSWKQIETRPHVPPALAPSWAERCEVLCSFPNLLCKQKAEPAQWGTTAVWKGSKSMQSSWDRALWVKAILRQFKYCVIVGRFFHARVTPWLSKTTFEMNGLWKRLFLATSEILNGAPGQFNYARAFWPGLHCSVESQDWAMGNFRSWKLA